VHYKLQPCGGAAVRADRGTTGRPRET
jgi:hypothetical protein